MSQPGRGAASTGDGAERRFITQSPAEVAMIRVFSGVLKMTWMPAVNERENGRRERVDPLLFMVKAVLYEH